MSYNKLDTKQYFWRTTQQQEIDLIEEQEGGLLKAFEFKWGKNEKVRFPQMFTENYPGSETLVISPENLEKFLMKLRLLYFYRNQKIAIQHLPGAY